MAETNPLVAVTGGNGLVGSHFVAQYADKYQFVHLDISSPTNPVDITDQDQVLQALADHQVAAIVHLAAFTDVTKAWEQQGDKSGLAYKVNVDGTKSIIQAANEHNAHLIHISTAYVFDGNKQEMYTEEDEINPIEWYGQTKAWAEEAVLQAANSATILRIDQPFRPDPFPKQDTYHRVLAGLQNGTLYPQFTNHYFGPTYIPDFSQIVNWTIHHTPQGIYHASSGEQWSDYDFACAIRDAHQLDTEVKPGDVHEYLKTSQRPYQLNTAMSNRKLAQEIDFELHKINTVL